jgi:hypothetical protein
MLEKQEQYENEVRTNIEFIKNQLSKSHEKLAKILEEVFQHFILPVRNIIDYPSDSYEYKDASKGVNDQLLEEIYNRYSENYQNFILLELSADRQIKSINVFYPFLNNETFSPLYLILIFAFQQFVNGTLSSYIDKVHEINLDNLIANMITPRHVYKEDDEYSLNTYRIYGNGSGKRKRKSSTKKKRVRRRKSVKRNHRK